MCSQDVWLKWVEFLQLLHVFHVQMFLCFCDNPAEKLNKMFHLLDEQLLLHFESCPSDPADFKNNKKNK